MNAERDDILISRIIDGGATPGEWDELSSLADSNPGVWRRLGEMMRDQTSFARAVNTSVAVADGVEIPVHLHRAPRERREHPVPVIRRLGVWSGWAVAAAVVLAWTIGVETNFKGRPPLDQGAPVQSARLLDTAAATDLLQAYLERGREDQSVIGEVPQRIIVETRPVQTGQGYELLYLRQILERRVVPDLYQLAARDELGRPTLVRYESPPRLAQ